MYRRYYGACVKYSPQVSLIALAVVFVLYWSWIDWERLVTFHLAVYDLGVNYQSIWAAAHGTSINVAGPAYTHSILFLFVPAFLITGSQEAFLVFLLTFQNVWMAIGVLPIYLLCRDRIGSRWLGSFLGASFLAFPATNGPVFFPFHFLALFPTLFLIAYYFYRMNKLWLSFVTFLLASITNIGALAIIAAFAVGLLAEPALSHFWKRIKRRAVYLGGFSKSRALFGTLILVEVAGVFLASVYIGGFDNILSFALRSSYGGLTGDAVSVASGLNVTGDAQLKLITVFLLFSPFLWVPLFAREERWAIAFYVALMVIFANFGFFLFPFRNQYSAFLLGPLFAGVLRGLERLRSRLPLPVGEAHSKFGLLRNQLRKARRPRPLSWGAFALLVVVGTGLVFAPWGPWNASLKGNPALGGGYYDLPALTGGNTTVDSELSHLIGTIPPNGWLLVQNDLPLAAGRSEYVVPGFYNLTLPLSYIIANPYGNSFYPENNFGPYNTSMYYWANYYLEKGWTIMGEADGALLLSKVPAPLTTYYPLALSFEARSFPCCSVASALASGENFSGQLIGGPRLPIDGAYSVLSPGDYELRVKLAVNHPPTSGNLTIQVDGDFGQLKIASFTYPSRSLGGSSGEVTLTQNVSFSQYYLGMYFGIYLNQWHGLITMKSLQLYQTSVL